MYLLTSPTSVKTANTSIPNINLKLICFLNKKNIRKIQTTFDLFNIKFKYDSRNSNYLLTKNCNLPIKETLRFNSPYGFRDPFTRYYRINNLVKENKETKKKIKASSFNFQWLQGMKLSISVNEKF